MTDDELRAIDALVAEAMGVEVPSSDEMSLAYINAVIAEYERRFGMTSEEFLRSVQDGTAPDTFEAMDWQILLKAMGVEMGE